MADDDLRPPDSVDARLPRPPLSSNDPAAAAHPLQPACQLCGGRLIDIRGKLTCPRCHSIWETCCEGGRW